MSCSHISNCALYPQISLSSALKIWQVFYCEGDFSKCSRYQASVAGKPVPDTLLPNGKNLELSVSSTDDKPASEEMVTAMKQEVEKESTGSALNELQDAMDAVVKEPVASGGEQGLLDDFVIDEPEATATGEIPDNPASTAGPTSSYYLRLRAQDKTGVMSSVISALGRHRISVDAMAQKRFAPGQPDTVMMLVTGQASPDKMNEAIGDLASINEINGNVISIPLEYLDEDMFS